ncbi:TolA-binding protein [Solimonas aquatica]|uniref:TolA-binding protein n=1 Tax=Solimonas aquatica TaxID=489703 RepID=A0A1H9HZB4_9GAMM|nr:tetratricopeptide repeat protein [Solimonas aquatica]SEQ67674.1 TolA-binding protein [Solimonas aquatica]
MTETQRRAASSRGLWKLAAIAQAAMLLASCSSPDFVKKAAPPIGKTIGRQAQPAPETLPIVKSQEIAADPKKAVDNYRELLALRPDGDTQDEAARRIADLQVQMADANGSTPEAEKNLHGSVVLYKKLLEDHPNDSKNDRIYYQLARAQQSLGDIDAAIGTLAQLSAKLPKSDLAGDAHFRRAELLFATSRYAEAETEYRTVMDLKDETPFFQSAQYKYGWALYKQSKYEPAIATFFDILDRELPPGTTTDPDAALAGVAKEKFDLARDSLRVVTLSLASLGGGSALNEYLGKHGDPRFYPLVYAALGDSLLEKKRYTDAAQASAAFITRYPASALAPAFQTRVIAAYDKGGFSELSIKEKERYATTYDPSAPYWQGKPPTEEVMKALRAHLEDVARYYHATAQAKAKAAAAGTPPPAEFLTAANWYRRLIALYPQDGKLPEINLLLGDALLDGGRTLEAAQQYSKTAYDYRAHVKAPEAAYAAVQAYQRYAKEVPAAQRAEALKLAIAESLKLAEQFPNHVQRYAVLTQTAEDYYELKDYDQAIAVAERVIHGSGNVTPDQQRLAWSVTGDSQFAQQHYPQAEQAFSEELKLTPAGMAQRRIEIGDQLAAAIYKQGEAARAAEDMKTAAYHFLRVGQITPQAKIRATAEFDGATALLALEDWPKAEGVLENFRRLFPGHALEADVDKKLAVAYQKDNKPLQAAQAYSRIARRGSEAPATREEAAWLSASLFDQGKSDADAAAAYDFYLKNFTGSFDRATEAHGRLLDYARASGDPTRLNNALREQIAFNDSAGARATDRSKALAAKSALELGRIAALQTKTIALTAPLEKSLPQRKQAMEQSLNWFNKAASYGFVDVATAATYETGALYQTFARALMDSERPKKLSELELEQYNLLLEEQANPFEEKAIQTYETNLQRIAKGVYDGWIAKSLQALVVLAPARYGKHEQGQDRYESLN